MSPLEPSSSAAASETSQSAEARQAEINAKRAERKAKKVRRPQEGHAADPTAAVNGDSAREGSEKPLFLKREWLRRPDSSLHPVHGSEEHGPGRSTTTLRIVSWNLLAQSLVRRELFPGSDCLKWPLRLPGLLAELAYYANGQAHGEGAGETEVGASDFACFQECDRLPSLLPAFPSHGCISARGRGKQHGLVILYSEPKWERIGDKVVYLDEEELDPISSPDSLPSSSTSAAVSASGNHAGDDGRSPSNGVSEAAKRAREARRRRGGTRETRNIALVGAFRLHSEATDSTSISINGHGPALSADDENGSESRRREEGGDTTGRGVLVATTHLFWHPKYSYERARQLVLLTRALRSFQRSLALAHPDSDIDTWPIILAGDFNTQPSEAVYQMFTDPVPISVPAASSSPHSYPVSKSWASTNEDDDQKGIHPVWTRQITESQAIHQSLDRVEANLTPAEDGTEALRRALEGWDPTGSKMALGSSTTNRATEGTQGQQQEGSSTPAQASSGEMATETGSGTPVAAAPNGIAEIAASQVEDDEGKADKSEHTASNTRPPREDDGLATLEELHGQLWELFNPGDSTQAGTARRGQRGARSAYDDWDWAGAANGGISSGLSSAQMERDAGTKLGAERTFEGRGGFPPEEFESGPPDGTKGKGEPGFTCYSSLFHLTLDYIFILPALQPSPHATTPVRTDVTRLLRPARSDELGEGLPKKGVSASDHLAVGAELVFAWAY